MVNKTSIKISSEIKARTPPAAWIVKALYNLLKQWYQYASFSALPDHTVINPVRALQLKTDTEKILKEYEEYLREVKDLSNGQTTILLPVDRKEG